MQYLYLISFQLYFSCQKWLIMVLFSVNAKNTGSFSLFPQTTRSPDLWMTDRVNDVRGEWRCIMGISGAPCASRVGIWRMLQWFAESSTAASCWTFRVALVSGGPAERCSGGMWNARAMSLPWISVNVPSMMMCVHTVRMLEWSVPVQDCLKDLFYWTCVFVRVCS